MSDKGIYGKFVVLEMRGKITLTYNSISTSYCYAFSFGLVIVGACYNQEGREISDEVVNISQFFYPPTSLFAITTREEKQQ